MIDALEACHLNLQYSCAIHPIIIHPSISSLTCLDEWNELSKKGNFNDNWHLEEYEQPLRKLPEPPTHSSEELLDISCIQQRTHFL